MNKQMKLHLETVVNSIVNEDADTAKAAFHEYLRMKTQSILLGESDEEECDEEDKEVDKDLEKVEKDVKKAKKDQKKDEKADKDEEEDEDDEDEDEK